MTPIRVLYLEDSDADAELVQTLLEEAAIACELFRVETQAEYAAALAAGGFTLILSDNTLPAYDGLSALAYARQRCPDLPFILVSGTVGEAVAIESLKAGATDYVLKQQLSRLAPAVARVLKETESRTARPGLGGADARARVLRWAHRTSQPCALRRPAAGGARPGSARRRGGGTVVSGPRPVQGGQRFAGASGRGWAAGNRRSVTQVPAGRRYRGALGRR